MGYGEASLAEIVKVHVDLLHESESLLGAKILYLGPDSHEVVRDRLGGTKKLTKKAEPVEINGGSVSFNPTEEFLKRVGIQSSVNAVLILSSSKMPLNFNRKDCSFIVSPGENNAQEMAVKEVQYLGQVGNYYYYTVIGLVSK